MSPEGRGIRALRSGLRAALRAGALATGRLRVVGRAAEPPFVLACNHAAFIDSLWLHLAVPVDLAVCGAHPRLFQSAPRRALMALGNVRCVPDDSSFRDVGGALLSRGLPVLAYPEGGRNPEGLGAFSPRVAALALAHGATLQPAYLRGTTRGHEGPTELRLGAPLPLEGPPSALTRRLRAAIEALS